GVAGGVPYVAVVLVSLWIPHRNIVIYIALLCSFLTVLGYFTSPAGGELWKVFSNRFLALFAIWVTAVLGLGRRRAEDVLREILDGLEMRVKERTKELSDEIAEHKRVEEKLRESETRFRMVHNTAFDCIIIYNASNDRVVQYNPSTEKMFGYSPDEMAEKKLVDLMPEEYRERHLAGVKRFLETGDSKVQGKVMVMQGLRKNGEVFPVELIINNFNLHGDTYFTGTIRDITDRVMMEEKTREVIQMEKLSSLGELMGGIAHQINNPLVGVVNFSQLVLKKMDKDHPLREDVETIRKAGIECRDIIKKLLAFSRQSSFEPVPLEANRLVDESLELLEGQFGLKKIHIDKFYKEKLPLLMLDPTLVKQVFFNIINNAWQAMSEGGRLQISTSLFKNTFHDDMVEINFSDNGVGIKEDDLQNVFKPFFTTKDGEGGVGIGLTVVQDIVNRHNGEIKVESKEGAGTTFTIRFQVNPTLVRLVKGSVKSLGLSTGTVKRFFNV
ncbi:MAG: ATP-binding protein, partial [Thermodesulfobacteriota bacterium]